MTPPKARKAAQAAPEPQEDPLADLREDDLTPREPETEPEDGAPVGEVRPMVTQETHDAMVDEAVVAWHADTTAQGFLHKGTRCGCRYLAKIALRSVVPVMTEDDLAERDLEPQEA